MCVHVKLVCACAAAVAAAAGVLDKSPEACAGSLCIEDGYRSVSRV